jgi:hypothetical protein
MPRPLLSAVVGCALALAACLGFAADGRSVKVVVSEKDQAAFKKYNLVLDVRENFTPGPRDGWTFGRLDEFDGEGLRYLDANDRTVLVPRDEKFFSVVISAPFHAKKGTILTDGKLNVLKAPAGIDPNVPEFIGKSEALGIRSAVAVQWVDDKGKVLHSPTAEGGATGIRQLYYAPAAANWFGLYLLTSDERKATVMIRFTVTGK